MVFKMKGYSYPGESLNMKKGKNVPLSEHEEKKGTTVIGGSKREEINDLENRIEFINSDISEESSVMKKGKMISQRNKLKTQLKKLRSN